MSWWERVKEWLTGTDEFKVETIITEQEWDDGQLTQEELKAGQLTDEELEQAIHNSHIELPREHDPLHDERDIRDSTNDMELDF